MIPIKRNKGRPKKSGNFYLEMDVLETHERLRKKHIGRNEAIKQTVNEVLPRHQGTCLSPTAVKIILANYQPEDEFLFPVGSPDNLCKGTFKVVKTDERTFTMKFAPRPAFQKRGRQIVRKNITFGRNAKKNT